MPPKASIASVKPVEQSKKRKEAPSSSNQSTKPPRSRVVKRVKMLDARTILSQTSDKALNSSGELDLPAFLKAREFEIKALEDGIRRSKGALTTRAFQEVPRDLRRRTASHNVKRVPKRLRRRAGREMNDDSTPVVKQGNGLGRGTRGRVRSETAKRLGALSRLKIEKRAEKKAAGSVQTRKAVPKTTPGFLRAPVKTKGRFRKRQVHKTWLPTHMWHAKRATMSSPKTPLWRFAIPVTPQEKRYRATHREAGSKGAVAWDMSYMSTIGLEGKEKAMVKLLTELGVVGNDAWGKKGEKWRAGKRSWTGWLSRDVGGEKKTIAPATLVWCAQGTIVAWAAKKVPADEDTAMTGIRAVPIKKQAKNVRRKLMIRTHPAAFLELWTEVLRLSKMQKPVVHVEDLRFDIGSIDITGPGATEALLGIVHPIMDTDSTVQSHAKTFTQLKGVTNGGALPANSLLLFSITDPRLHYPPRKINLPDPSDVNTQFALLQTLSSWPCDASDPSQDFFDRYARYLGTQLPSQKSLNRRKTLTSPGEYPAVRPTDPSIPIMLLNSRTNGSKQGTWTLLAPWKCILPIWYGLMHFPLSSGGNPSFGGLQELQQLRFERGESWYPGDCIGTDSGWKWELDERERRRKEWEGRPKGKRVEWETLDLGNSKKGELGLGWACNFELFLKQSDKMDVDTPKKPDLEQVNAVAPSTTSPFIHLPKQEFNTLFQTPNSIAPENTLITIRIKLCDRGVPQPCARIYRIPLTSDSIVRKQWLALLSSTKPPQKAKKERLPAASLGLSAAAMEAEKRRILAASLLEDPPMPYPKPEGEDVGPPIPGEEDLLGFVTTGAFNLAEGKGVGVGSLAVKRVLEGARIGKESKLCIIRNAGERVGRLGVWVAV